VLRKAISLFDSRVPPVNPLLVKHVKLPMIEHVKH